MHLKRWCASSIPIGVSKEASSTFLCELCSTYAKPHAGSRKSNQTRIKSDDLGRCRYICIHTFKCPECLPCIACCDDLRLIHAYISMNRRSYFFLSMLLCSCCFLVELQVKEFANQAVTYFNACFGSFLQSLYILHSDFLAPARTRHSMQGCGS